MPKDNIKRKDEKEKKNICLQEERKPVESTKIIKHEERWQSGRLRRS